MGFQNLNLTRLFQITNLPLIMIKENNSKRVLKKKNGLGRFGLCMLQLQAAVGTQGECFL